MVMVAGKKVRTQEKVSDIEKKNIFSRLGATSP